MFFVFVGPVTSLKPITSVAFQVYENLQYVVTVKEGFFSPLSKWRWHRYLTYPSRLLLKHLPEEVYLPNKWYSLLPLSSTTSLMQYLNCNVSFWMDAHHGEIHTCMEKSLGPSAPTTPALSKVIEGRVSLATEGSAPHSRRGLCTGRERYWLEVRCGNL